MDHAEHGGFEHFYTTKVPRPAGLEDSDAVVKWKRIRSLARALLTSSTRQVHTRLESAGWDRDTMRDPKEIWDIILKTIPTTSELNKCNLVTQWVNMTLEPGMTLENFNVQFVQRANKLDQLGMKQTGDFKTSLLLNKIQSRYPDWHRMIEWKVLHDEVKWKDVQEEVHRKASAEVADRTMMSLIAAGTAPVQPNGAVAKPTNAPAAPDDSEPDNYESNNSQPKSTDEAPWIHCNLCDKRHKADWPYCEACGKHHPGGPPKCFKLHPERQRNQQQVCGSDL